MSLLSIIAQRNRSAGGYDPDAQAWFTALTTAGSSINAGNMAAVSAFVTGCKADGIWTAIKASCLLCAANDLTGALVPLVGAAPTNVGFVSGDYSRTLGLQGASGKYLNANRANDVDPQDNRHGYIYATSADLRAVSFVTHGTQNTAGGSCCRYSSGTQRQVRAASFSAAVVGGAAAQGVGGCGYSRSTSGTINRIFESSAGSSAGASVTPSSDALSVFAGTGATHWFGRSSFYSFGEAVNLTLLDARLTTLMAALT